MIRSCQWRAILEEYTNDLMTIIMFWNEVENHDQWFLLRGWGEGLDELEDSKRRRWLLNKNSAENCNHLVRLNYRRSVSDQNVDYDESQRENARKPGCWSKHRKSQPGNLWCRRWLDWEPLWSRLSWSPDDNGGDDVVIITILTRTVFVVRWKWTFGGIWPKNGTTISQYLNWN